MYPLCEKEFFFLVLSLLITVFYVLQSYSEWSPDYKLYGGAEGPPVCIAKI